MDLKYLPLLKMGCYSGLVENDMKKEKRKQISGDSVCLS